MARYFLHIAPTSRAAFYWRPVQNFSSVPVHINLNLLAAAEGDIPPTGLTLAQPMSYNTGVPGVDSIDLQPFVEMRAVSPVELPIGPNLKNKLDYPLGGTETMNLSLPVYDSSLGIGDSGGGWFRKSEDSGSYHGGLGYYLGFQRLV